MNTVVADPHWGWWIVWYFYLGGIAAGAYLVATLVEFVGDEQDRRMGRVGYFLAAPLVAVCGILLILDLEQPTRFWHMLFDAETFRPHVKYWSPMSIGAWALLVFGAISTISFVGALAESSLCGLGRFATLATRLHRGFFGRAFDVFGTVSGFFIAAYTGTLLTATNQPVWSDNPWIAALFLASAATSGIAATGLIAPLVGYDTATTRAKLERADAWALGLEFVTLVLFLSSLGLSVRELSTYRPFVLLIGGTLGMGMCLPLVLRTFPGLLGKRSSLIVSAFVLLGGFVLRYSILAAAPAMHERAAGGTSIRATGGEPTSLSQAASVPDLRADVFEELLTLVRDRLDLMDDVALAKWQAAKPIEDLERERELLQALQHEATARNISPAAVSVFFQAQIRAGKQVQQAYFDEWTRVPPSLNQGPDLASVLRPKLDSLNSRLLDSLVRSAHTFNDPSRREAIRRLGEYTLENVRLLDHERTELLDGLLQSAEVLSERTDRSD